MRKTKPNRWLVRLLAAAWMGLILWIGGVAVSEGRIQARGWRLEGAAAVVAGVGVLAFGLGLGMTLLVRSFVPRPEDARDPGDPSEGERAATHDRLDT